MNWVTYARRVAAAGVALVVLAGSAQAHAGIRLLYIGQATLPTGYTFDGTEVGGLSGIDYNPVTQRYVAISDDRGQHGPVRFYHLSIDLSDGMLDTGDIAFDKVTSVVDDDDQPLTAGSVDPESIRVSPFPGVLYWTSEGDASRGIGPSVRTMTPAGRPLAPFQIPSAFSPGDQHGIRNNLAFESLTFSGLSHRWYTAVENALLQDGPAASLDTGSPARVLAFDADTGKPVAQYIYRTSPVPDAPKPSTAFATNGLSELLNYNAGAFIALERSFSTGVGNDIRLYLTTPIGATNVQELDSIKGHRVRPMKKALLMDLADLPITLDNIEGMTFGPDIGGDRTLILVSDNNFSDSQVTQFLAFRIRDDRRSSSEDGQSIVANQQ